MEDWVIITITCVSSFLIIFIFILLFVCLRRRAMARRFPPAAPGIPTGVFAVSQQQNDNPAFTPSYGAYQGHPNTNSAYPITAYGSGGHENSSFYNAYGQGDGLPEYNDIPHPGHAALVPSAPPATPSMQRNDHGTEGYQRTGH